MSIRVAITDDHPMVVDGLCMLLDSFDNIEVCGTYHSGASLFTGLQQVRPDVLLLDLQLPDQHGDVIARRVREEYPDIRILVITVVDQPFYIRQMIRLGCAGYLLKNADRETILEAIESVYNRQQFIMPALKEMLLQQTLQLRKPAGGLPVLTHREKEVLQLIAAEYTSHDIARKLFLSHRTVENHRKNLLQKFQAKNMIGLIKTAVQAGLID